MLDTLWDMALNFKLNDDSFTQLLKMCQRVSLTNLDKSLDCFESNAFIPWGDVISQLWPIYGTEKAGCIFRKDGSRQYFFAKCPQDNNILIYLEYRMLQNASRVYLLRKNQDNDRNCSETEADLISEFVNHVCVLLWKLCLCETMFFRNKHEGKNNDTSANNTS
jgi:hypothetical protein